MASFDYSSFVVFNRNGNSANIGEGSGTDVPGGQLTDFDANSDFSIGENLSTNGGGSVVGTYYGNYTSLSGTTYIVVEVAAGTYHFYSALSSADARADLPNTLSTASPSGDLSQTAITPCFLAGTRIAGAEGDRNVEDLRIGDRILTEDGRAVAVKWIGRKLIRSIFTPPTCFLPVRVRAGALGGGLPHADLLLTADHGLMIDGLLCNAGALVNGITIDLVPPAQIGESYTVYHVETEGREVILANGAAVETFVDYVTRRAFDNHAEYVALYGDERVIGEMPCPRIASARLLPPLIRARLAASKVA